MNPYKKLALMQAHASDLFREGKTTQAREVLRKADALHILLIRQEAGCKPKMPVNLPASLN